MWQNPNQRLRAVAKAKKREKDRLKRPFHVKRVVAHIILNAGEKEEKIPVRVVLNDLGMKGVGLFSPYSFIPGQEVIIAISAPMEVQITSKVIWCQQHDANSHILSSQPHSYRLGLEFLYSSRLQQESIKALIDEVAQNFLYTTKSA